VGESSEYLDGEGEGKMGMDTKDTEKKLSSSVSFVALVLNLPGYRPWLDVLVAPPGSLNAMYSPEYAPPPTATMMYCLPSAE
jgi:hypothetical protein